MTIDNERIKILEESSNGGIKKEQVTCGDYRLVVTYEDVNEGIDLGNVSGAFDALTDAGFSFKSYFPTEYLLFNKEDKSVELDLSIGLHNDLTEMMFNDKITAVDILAKEIFNNGR